MRGVSGFGMIALLIVMAIVLLLVARSWESMAPAALDVSGIPGMEAQATGSGSGTPPSGAVVPPPGSIPADGDDDKTPVERKFSGVRDARRTTDAHSQQLEDVLKQTE